MMRFFVKALAVFAVIGAIGIIQVDRVYQRRIASGEPMTFSERLKEMNKYEPPTNYAGLWPVKEVAAYAEEIRNR